MQLHPVPTSSANSVSIYALSCPLSGHVRYIGRSKNVQRRYIAHLSSYRNTRNKEHTRVARWIGFLSSVGLSPTLSIIDVVTEDFSGLAESFWIKVYRDKGNRLTNLTDGGDGVINPSKEARERISRALKGRKIPADQLAKRVASQTGRKASDQARENMSRAQTGHKASEQARHNMSEAQRARKHYPLTQEQREQMQEKVWSRPRTKSQLDTLARARTMLPKEHPKEWVNKRVASRAGYRHSEETRAKMRASCSGPRTQAQMDSLARTQASLRGKKQPLWAVEKRRQSMLGFKHSEESKLRISEAKRRSNDSTL